MLEGDVVGGSGDEDRGVIAGVSLATGRSLGGEVVERDIGAEIGKVKVQATRTLAYVVGVSSA